MNNNTHFKAILLTTFAVFLMSLESLFIKLTFIGAFSFSFYIGIFMIISINIFIYQDKNKNMRQVYTTGIKALLICGFLFGISNLFFILAIKTTSVANTVMILSTGPIFASLYDFLLYKIKSTINIYISSFFIFSGLYIIFYNQIGSSDMIGNFYALVCVNAFSLAFVLMSKHKEIDRFAVTSIAGFITAIISFVFLKSLSIDLNTFYILLFSGLIISPISRVLLGMGTKTLPASEVGLLMIVETILAPIWVWIFLDEILNSSTLIGAFVILLTLILNSFYLIKINKKTTNF